MFLLTAEREVEACILTNDNEFNMQYPLIRVLQPQMVWTEASNLIRF